MFFFRKDEPQSLRAYLAISSYCFTTADIYVVIPIVVIGQHHEKDAVLVTSIVSVYFDNVEIEFKQPFINNL